MKKPVAILTAACLMVLAAGPLVLNSSADNLGFTLLTTPETPYGWTPSFSVGQGTAAHTGSVEYTGGPEVPNAQGDGDVTPHGGGSLTLRSGSNADTMTHMNNPYLDGALLAGVDIEYSWITTRRPTSGTAAAPGLQLYVRRGDGTVDTLHYEPYWNRDTPQFGRETPKNLWQRDDAGAAGPGACHPNRTEEACGPGLWWASSTGQETRYTLSQYATTHTGTKVRSDRTGGGFAVVAGCCNANEFANFEGAVDDVTLRRAAGDPTTTFDFEPTILTVFPGAQQGWTFAATPATPNTTPPSVALMQGPGDPFFRTGSVQFAVGDNGDSSAEARTPDLDGRTVAGIEALTYGTYVQSRSDGGTCPEAPYLRLDVVRVVSALAPAGPQTLMFHPCDQGVSPDTGEWARWDAKNGTWRWQEPLAAARAEANRLNDPDICDDTTQTCKGTLAQYTAIYPGDETVATSTAGSLRIGAGGGNATNPNSNGAATPSNNAGARWAGFKGNADFLTRDHSAIPGRDYDFEAQAPPPPATTTTTDPNAPSTSTTLSGGSTTSSTVRRVTTTTQAGSGTTTTTSSTSTTDPDSSASIRRMQGGDRFDTAIEISQSSFSDDGAEAVVLARGDDYPDALAATPLAINRRGPLLLTWPSDLEARVEDEIRRVLPDGGTVHIAGGPVAVGPAVEARLKADGFNVLRHSGRNRFETATLIAEQITAPQIAFLATGTNFADALPSGAAAGAEAGVVVLTSGTSMPPETAAYLHARPGLRRVAVGGQAAAAAPEAEPIVGNDRFETAVAVARRFFSNPTSAAVANGTHYADALAGGPHIGSRGGPLLLTRIESLPQTARDWLAEHRASLRNVYIYGGPNAVSANTQSEIQSATS